MGLTGKGAGQGLKAGQQIGWGQKFGLWSRTCVTAQVAWPRCIDCKVLCLADWQLMVKVKDRLQPSVAQLPLPDLLQWMDHSHTSCHSFLIALQEWCRQPG